MKWRRASKCWNGPDCVEVTFDEQVHIRDKSGEVQTVNPMAFMLLISDIKLGRYDA